MENNNQYSNFDINYKVKDYINKPNTWIEILITLFLFCIIKIMQRHIITADIMNMLLLQIQFIIFIALIISIKKLGLLVAIVLNLAECLGTAIKLCLSHDINLISSLLYPICMIFTVCVAYFLFIHLLLQEIKMQKELFYLLNQEVVLTKNELEKQNEQLMEYWNMIKKKNEEQIPEVNIDLEDRLLSSMENNELFLVYQPLYSTKDKRLRGFEALVRWYTPKHGVICPAYFIPAAEKNGYIIKMGEWIFKNACLMLNKIKETFGMDIIMSVNISVVQLMHPSFVSMVKKNVREVDVDARCLEFEITESVLITSMDYVKSILKQIKEMGIKIALDDFGTGYSSFEYLDKLPTDTLKIDKTFVDSICIKNMDKNIVGSIVTLAHGLNMTAVAEGVEKEEQLTHLRKCNCDFIQGYLWGKPLEEGQVMKLMEEILQQKDMKESKKAYQSTDFACGNYT